MPNLLFETVLTKKTLKLKFETFSQLAWLKFTSTLEKDFSQNVSILKFERDWDKFWEHIFSTGNRRQSIWQKVKVSSKVRQDKEHWYLLLHIFLPLLSKTHFCSQDCLLSRSLPSFEIFVIFPSIICEY